MIAPGAPVDLAAPAPLYLFKALLGFTFTLHLLFVNAVWGGSFLTAVYLFKGQEKHREVAAHLASYLPPLTAFAILFGVAPLLFVQALYGRLFYTASILLGTPFLLVIPVLLGAYGLLYLLERRLAEGGKEAPWIALGAFLGLGYVGFTLANLLALLSDPERFPAKYLSHPGGFQFNLADFTVLPRFLHFFLASVALAGLVVAIRGARRLPLEPERGRWQYRSGITWFAGATLVNFAAGTWWLLALPSEGLRAAMGGSLPGTFGFAAGLLFGLAALVLSLLGINSLRAGAFLNASAACLLLTVFSMVLLRDAVRDALLRAAGESPPVFRPQWGALSLFLVLFLAGSALAVYLFVALARARRAARKEEPSRPGLSDSGVHAVSPAESGVRKLLPSDSQPLRSPSPPSSGVHRLDDEP